MRKGQATIRLSPLHGGAFTQFTARGTVPSGVSEEHLRRFMTWLSFWNGWPVRGGLPADVEAADWFSYWTGAFERVPVHQIEIVTRRARRG